MKIEFPVLVNNEVITLMLDEETAARASKGKIKTFKI